MTNSVKLLVMGMPRVGKTTFLAALWHVLTSEEVGGALTLDFLQPSRGHLNTITKLWREWKEIPRTTMTKERSITINLRIPGQPRVFTLEVPDASGDAFRRMFEMRQCRAEFAELASSAEGILLFIHPRHAVAPQSIDATVAAMIEEVAEDDEVEAVGDTHATPARDAGSAGAASAQAISGEESTSAVLKWAPHRAAYQAKLVDLLQITNYFRDTRPCRISVIVSAWDLCLEEKLPPDRWLENRLPLLYQYLVSNQRKQPFEVFGISAQGAELNNPGVLLDLIHASGRISVISRSGLSKDITLPIRFLIETSGNAI